MKNLSLIGLVLAAAAVALLPHSAPALAQASGAANAGGNTGVTVGGIGANAGTGGLVGGFGGGLGGPASTFGNGFYGLSLIHISEPTRQAEISYAVFCLK